MGLVCAPHYHVRCPKQMMATAAGVMAPYLQWRHTRSTVGKLPNMNTLMGVANFAAEIPAETRLNHDYPICVLELRVRSCLGLGFMLVAESMSPDNSRLLAAAIVYSCAASAFLCPSLSMRYEDIAENERWVDWTKRLAIGLV